MEVTPRYGSHLQHSTLRCWEQVEACERRFIDRIGQHLACGNVPCRQAALGESPHQLNCEKWIPTGTLHNALADCLVQSPAYRRQALNQFPCLSIGERFQGESGKVP